MKVLYHLQYHPKDIFGEDEILLEAILRRFKIIHMVDKTLGLWGNNIVDPMQPELERRWGTHSTQLKIINVQLNYYGHVDS